MAIDYTKVGWDTTKYVNPTNMNQMDNGIKAACDGVDGHDTAIAGRVKLSNAGMQTIHNTSASDALAIKSSINSQCWLDFYGNNGTLIGKFGISNNLPYCHNGTNTYELAKLADVVKSSTNGIQTIENTAANGATPLILKGNYSFSRVEFQNSSGTRLGQLGVDASNNPTFWTPNLTAKEIALKDDLKTIVANSTDFANFKTRIANW